MTAALKAGAVGAYTDVTTWTPVPRGSSTAGSPTGTFVGTYTRVGNIVFVQFSLVFTGLSTMAGNFEIAGLPVTVGNVNNASNGSGAISFRNAWTNDFSMNLQPVKNDVYMKVWRSNADNTQATITDLSATSEIIGSAFYFA